MSYTALYRKFRPAVFDEVKGQDPIVQTLRSQILNKRVGHAYLFCGTRGTGKTSVAKIFARAVNCEDPNGADPCGKCASCLAAASGSSANIIEIDAASNNSVDNVRDIREEVAYRPVEGRYKVYIIDEVHMLSTGAFNALLKTLEEPPEYVIFILATTESAKIPVTILSRCQRYDFRRISADEIYARLKELAEKEGAQIDEKGLRYLSRQADGSMRDAVSLLDQCISSYAGKPVAYDDILKLLGSSDTKELEEIVRAIFSGDVAGSIKSLDEFAQSGKEMARFASDITMFLRSMLIAKNTENAAELLDMSEENFADLKKFSEETDAEKLMRCLRIFSELTGILRNSAMKRVDTELALIKACRPQTEHDTQSLSQRLSLLEEKFENGLPVREVIKEVPAKGESEGKEAKKEVFPEKAAPEDLKLAAEHWQELVGGADDEIRKYLQGSVPSYNSRTGENVLYVRLGNPVCADRLMAEINTQAREAFEYSIGKLINRQASVKYTGTGNSDNGIREIPIEKKIAEKISIPLEVE